MKKRILHIVMFCLFAVLVFGGCSDAGGESGNSGARGKDWDYTVVPVKDCPEDFLKELEEKKINAFQMTYDDGSYLYIAVGYGEQPSGGFSIQVQGLYEKGTGLCLETSLVGPDEDTLVSERNSYPYIVIKTQKTEKEVYFL